MTAKTCTCSLLGIDATISWSFNVPALAGSLVIQFTGFSRNDPFPFERITVNLAPAAMVHLLAKLGPEAPQQDLPVEKY
jgi:hypothetical protein